MLNGIIGRKVGMTQIFEDSGEAIPVTVIQAGPCPIVQLKTQEKDGYQAVQLGFGKQKESRINKPKRGISPKLALTRHSYFGNFVYRVSMTCL